jgi:hypothetical protein
MHDGFLQGPSPLWSGVPEGRRNAARRQFLSLRRVLILHLLCRKRHSPSAVEGLPLNSSHCTPVDVTATNTAHNPSISLSRVYIKHVCMLCAFPGYVRMHDVRSHAVPPLKDALRRISCRKRTCQHVVDAMRNARHSNSMLTF